MADEDPEFVLTWRKSTFSGDHGCVEIAFTPKTAHLRNTRNRAGERLAFGAAAWTAFRQAVVRP
ncbi:DUF397 domain-containing protein [Actinosynnema sp. NPDC020468]|uniref:DUF397 domain-containing protein n=1 Tax=Actinosynnema sp. NPDC020468 TaxID=3154488 RepID=UPI0033F9B50F